MLKIFPPKEAISGIGNAEMIHHDSFMGKIFKLEEIMSPSYSCWRLLPASLIL